MEIIRKSPVVVRRKAAPPPPVASQTEKKKKGGTPCNIDLVVKLSELPELKTDGKKFARITVRSETYGYMELFVNPKTYRRCKLTLNNGPSSPELEHMIIIEVPFDKAEKDGGKVIARGCGLKVIEKKKKVKKETLN